MRFMNDEDAVAVYEKKSLKKFGVTASVNGTRRVIASLVRSGGNAPPLYSCVATRPAREAGAEAAADEASASGARADAADAPCAKRERRAAAPRDRRRVLKRL